MTSSRRARAGGEGRRGTPQARDDLRAADAAGPEGEQQVDALAGAAVGELRLIRADGLPGIDGLAEDRVDWFGEGGAGLVGWDVEETDGLAGQDLLGVTGDGGAVVLQRVQAHPQSGNLVAALSG
ncbi:hypothetical protein BOQ63_007240 (plasmid) [Streptomyces viridifaciens]|nr:hypothetical protein BOQ63_007240 [Streptomyces viridifaciens]